MGELQPEFEREERYLVVKINKLHPDYPSNFRDLAVRKIKAIAGAGGALVDCVVVEHDWPEYETVWKMIEDRVLGKPSKLQILEQQHTEMLRTLTLLSGMKLGRYADSIVDKAIKKVGEVK